MEIRSVTLARAAHQGSDFPRDDRPQFAMVGRSNVGKSSLINALLGRRKQIARVSQTPGKTQGIYFYLVNERIYVVDLPGYGFAKVAKRVAAGWEELVRSYLEKGSRQLRRIFLLIDSRRSPNSGDLQMRDWCEAAGLEWTAVMTKADKLSHNELARSRREMAKALDVDPGRIIPFSRITRGGVDRLWSEIEKTLNEDQKQRKARQGS